MRRLFPDPTDDIDVADAYRAPLGAHTDRPWVGLCMVTSIDGSTVVNGRSGGLSSATDVAVLAQLRRVADVVVVGSATVRGEGYGRPGKPGQRIGVVTASGSVDTSTELFTSGAGFVITTDTTPIDTSNGDVDVIRAGRDHVELHTAIRRLRSICVGASFVQVEGGPLLNGSMMNTDLFDELNITTSAATVGGNGARLATGAVDHSHRFDLAQVAIDDESFLYCRWLRRRG